MDVNKTLAYQGITYKIVFFDRKNEFDGKKAPEGKEFLVFNMEAKNNLGKQVIIFYDEEARLLTENNEAIPPYNYKIENNFDAGAEAAGYFLFLVNQGINNFTFQFSKKVGPKAEIVFKNIGG